MRFTDFPSRDRTPLWSPDGDWVYFASKGSGETLDLWKKRADSPESSAVFVMEHGGADFYPLSLSDDERHLTYLTLAPTWDIWAARVDQDDTEKRLLKGTSAKEHWGVVSPGAKWLAYTSNSTGTEGFYLASFDDPDNRPRRITADAARMLT